jgi:long-chain acyl-CoA synthetase
LEFSDRFQLIQHPQVLELINQAVNRYNLLFNHVEQVKKFTLLPEEWTIDGGELTPTLKLKRKVIEAKYQTLIEDMYA